MQSRTRRGVAAFGVATLMAGGALLTPLAAVADTEAQSAPTDDAGYQSFVQELIAEDAAITSVGRDGDGNVVVSAEAGTLADDTVATLEAFDNVVLQDRGVIQALGIDDVVGGAGYIVNRASVCSTGFSGWSPAGDPVVITAGHCGTAGATVELSVPSEDDAPYYPSPARYAPGIFDSFGEIVFSQWGGPGGSEGASGDLASTDIAIIDVTNADLTMRPFVTNWSTWASEDLSLSGTAVTGVGTVAVGDSITRSGRTTGFHSGQVIEIDAWTRVCEVVQPVPTNCHWVSGFFTDAPSAPGDSGGAFLKGSTAVGVLSGGNGSVSFATNLQNGLAQTGGYTVMLDLAEPVVTSPTVVAPGGTISGTAPAGLNLDIAQGSAGESFPVPASGTWSFPAPTAAGTYTYVLQVADSGFNRSESVQVQVVVDPDLLPQPDITSPGDGATVTGPSVTISGVGAPTADIALSGDVTGTAVVAADGTWSVTADAPYGEIDVIATQTYLGNTATTALTFTVAPALPTLTSPADGAVLTTAPTEITGTAVDGAEIVVALDGTEIANITVRSGASAGMTAQAALAATAAGQRGWTVAIPSALADGKHTITVTQAVAGFTETIRASFTVQAAPAGGGNGGTGGGGSAGSLPATGMDAASVAGPAALGAGLVLAAGALLLIARRRRSSEV